LVTLTSLNNFSKNIRNHKKNLINLVRKIKKDGKTIIGYGASTKGNVLLQYCGFSKKHISAIADRNPNKYGHFTPGTGIPIISEKKAREAKPDYFLVLPWPFRDEFIKREKSYFAQGGKFIFPLPKIDVYAQKD